MKKLLVIFVTIGVLTLAAALIQAHGVFPAYQQGFEQDTEG